MSRTFLVLLMAATLTGCSARSAPSAEPSAPLRAVRAVEPVIGSAEPPVVVHGVLAPRDEARLSFTVGGVIRRITVHEGDVVAKGQVLAELDPTETEARLTQAREAHEKSVRDFRRAERLYEQEVVTREQLDDLLTAEVMARARLSEVQFNRRRAVIVGLAPGRVLRRLVDEHEQVPPGQAVLVVSNRDGGFRLHAGLADRDFLRVNIGAPALIRFDALSERTFHGRIVELSRAADSHSGTFGVEVSIEESDDTLAYGLIGDAQINTGSRDTRTYVPLTALVESEQTRASLFVLDGNTARARAVVISFISGDTAALAEPLPAGARVITDGATYLHDAEQVRVVP
jgi:multidrug efflux system membrane fusion protein